MQTTKIQVAKEYTMFKLQQIVQPKPIAQQTQQTQQTQTQQTTNEINNFFLNF
jgi:hypothetical protein